MEQIETYELKKIDLKGAVVIDGFPSVGLVSSIVANYLISLFDLEQIGVMDSLYFPTVSLIRDSEPHNPVRIYASEKEEGKTQMAIFISEFQPPPNIIKPIARSMLEWCMHQRCSLLVSPEGLVLDTSEVDGQLTDEELKERRVAVYGVGSTPTMRALLSSKKVEPFVEGVITGVAGVLLNEGKMRDFDVLGLLTEAHPDYPDARSAANIIEVLDELVLHMDIDPKPLYEEAEKVEGQIKSLHKQTTAAKRPGKRMAAPSMYG
ncbi:MAG: PAC2 family protein [Candidatus Thermoplasmatota archaeon]|nr:PAC2 family protein [Candidatus Thermoplasmatota archaeon]